MPYSKSIGQLFSEIECVDIKDYLTINKAEFIPPLHQYLKYLLESKNLLKTDVVRKSDIERHYAYHIFSGRRQNPSRDKILALAMAMQLNLEETQELLNHARLCQLYPRSPSDSIIISAINQSMDVMQTNELLRRLGEPDSLG